LSETVAITLLTLKVGALSLAFSLAPGIGLGWLLSRKRFPGRLILQTILTLPLVLPPVAVGLGLLLLLSGRGPVGALCRSLVGWNPLFTWQAAALASCVMSLPLLVRASQQAFASVPARLEHAAATLGSSPWRVFTTVTLPLARRGIAYGVLLSFARGLGEFGATTLIAGSIPGRTETLALGIYGRVQRGDDRAALGLAAVSAAMAFGATYLSERWLARSERESR